MKKLYMEPELELVTLRLTADVLVASKEDELPSEMDDFEDGNFGDDGMLD